MKLKLKRYWSGLAALLVVAAHATSHAATTNSPVLTTNAGWDCLISGKGSEQGILFLTFTGDGFSGNGTFDGAMVLAKVASFKPATDRSGSSSPRDPSAPPAPAITNIYGFAAIDGRWNYDANGYTVGVFTYNLMDATSTNLNQVSFKAKISPNKRLTASFSSSLGGNGTIRGVPIKTVTNALGFPGSWSATEKSGSLTRYEWLSLSPIVSKAAPSWPNIYSVSGYGPGYDVSGICMVSSQKKIGFGTLQSYSPTNQFTRGTVGSLINKSTSLGGKMKGLSEEGTNVMSYDAFWVTSPVAE